MKLLIVRHAIAEDREAFALTGQEDAERPLTDGGRRKMRAALKGLRQIVESIDVIATSPLVRARQTADIIARGYENARNEVTDSLRPDRHPSELVSWIMTLENAEVVAVVGHEPHLGEVASFALCGAANSFVELKKGGACLLEFPNEPAEGKARLLWLLTPGQLRSLQG